MEFVVIKQNLPATFSRGFVSEKQADDSIGVTATLSL